MFHFNAAPHWSANANNLWEFQMRAAHLIAVAALLLLTACHTVQGVGEDLNSAGHSITNTATDVQKKL